MSVCVPFHRFSRCNAMPRSASCPQHGRVDEPTARDGPTRGARGCTGALREDLRYTEYGGAGYPGLPAVTGTAAARLLQQGLEFRSTGLLRHGGRPQGRHVLGSCHGPNTASPRSRGRRSRASRRRRSFPAVIRCTFRVLRLPITRAATSTGASLPSPPWCFGARGSRSGLRPFADASVCRRFSSQSNKSVWVPVRTRMRVSFS